MSSAACRRPKWHPTPPPPPSPKILHFPRSRRSRRKLTKHNPPLFSLSYKPKLQTLFDQDTTQRRERVEEHGGGGGSEEEKWRFQAEILRAECNLLRMEREFAVKKLEKNRVKMESTLRSAVHTLVSGRDKICEGQSARAVLEEEIEELAEKLEELQKRPRNKDSEVVKCSNFDKKASLLQRRLEKLGALSLSFSQQNVLSHSFQREEEEEEVMVDRERKKEERESDSKEKVEEDEEDYNSIGTANTSVASSASTSKRMEFPLHFSCISNTHLSQEATRHENKCSGRCKVVVRRIVEQVRAETEQWSQMQEMLKQVRGEMEELQISRDFWENRAHTSDCQIQSLQQSVEEWKEKAADYEHKASVLQRELSALKEEMQKSKLDFVKKHSIVDEEINVDEVPNKDLQPLSLGKQLAKEKRMLLRRLKENRHGNVEEDGRRKPLRDINGDCDLHNSFERYRRRESFRK